MIPRTPNIRMPVFLISGLYCFSFFDKWICFQSQQSSCLCQMSLAYTLWKPWEGQSHPAEVSQTLPTACLLSPAPVQRQRCTDDGCVKSDTMRSVTLAHSTADVHLAWASFRFNVSFPSDGEKVTQSCERYGNEWDESYLGDDTSSTIPRLFTTYPSEEKTRCWKRRLQFITGAWGKYPSSWAVIYWPRGMSRSFR